MIRRRKKMLYGFVIPLICFIILEVAARLTTPARPWLNARYVAISQPFAQLDALIDDAGWGPGSGPKFYAEFLYAARPSTKVHITFTDYFSARRTPDSVPLADAVHIVWTFGGSTMQNTETTDRLTIANTWAQMFNRALGPTHIKNFGTGGFNSSYELIKFQKLLREVPEDERPTMAIFYDGYNDAVQGFQFGAGSIQKDLSLKLEALVERKDFKLWAYASSNLIARWSRLWDRTGKKLVDTHLFPLGEPSADSDNLAKTIQSYASNVRMIMATCETFGVRCFFILQPLLFTKTPLAPLEQEALAELEAHPRFGSQGKRFVQEFYAQVPQALAREPAFIDASAILDGISDPVFYDIGHTGALASPIIGTRIGDKIIGLLETRNRANR